MREPRGQALCAHGRGGEPRPCAPGGRCEGPRGCAAAAHLCDAQHAAAVLRVRHYPGPEPVRQRFRKGFHRQRAWEGAERAGGRRRPGLSAAARLAPLAGWGADAFPAPLMAPSRAGLPSLKTRAAMVPGAPDPAAPRRAAPPTTAPSCLDALGAQEVSEPLAAVLRVPAQRGDLGPANTRARGRTRYVFGSDQIP